MSKIKETKTCSDCNNPVDTKGNDWTSDSNQSKNTLGETNYWHLKCRASKLEINEEIKSQ